MFNCIYKIKNNYYNDCRPEVVPKDGLHINILYITLLKEILVQGNVIYNYNMMSRYK